MGKDGLWYQGDLRSSIRGWRSGEDFRKDSTALWRSFLPLLSSPAPCTHTSIREELFMAHILAHRDKWTRLIMDASGHLGILEVPNPTNNTLKELRGLGIPI